MGLDLQYACARPESCLSQLIGISVDSASSQQQLQDRIQQQVEEHERSAHQQAEEWGEKLRSCQQRQEQQEQQCEVLESGLQSTLQEAAEAHKQQVVGSKLLVILYVSLTVLFQNGCCSLHPTIVL
jgi:exonuclease VII large subunit